MNSTTANPYGITPADLARLGKRDGPLANLIVALVSIFLVLPVMVVSLRLYVRLHLAKQFRLDDFFMVLATIFAIAATIAICFNSKLGTLSTDGLKAVLLFHVLYYTAVWAVKMSVISFCHKIFGRIISPRMNFLIWGSMGMVTIIWIVSLGTSVFSCSPVSALWNALSVLRQNGCVNVARLHFALALINAVTDFLVMYLPVVLIKTTMMDVGTRKRYLTTIFLLALFASCASIGRVISYAITSSIIHVPHLTQRKNIWVLLPIFTSLELNIAISASSLPSLSPLILSTIQRFAPKCSASDPYSPILKPITTDQKGEYDLGAWEDGTGIKVDREYSVTRSSPRLPMQAHSPVRGPRMEARSGLLQGRRMSFMEMLRQGPPGEEDRASSPRRRGKAGEVLGV